MATNCDQAMVETEGDEFEEALDKSKEFTKSKAMDFGECLSLPSLPPPKKARVEIQGDEFEEALDKTKEEFTKTQADNFEETYKKFKEECSMSDGFDIQTFPDIHRYFGGMRKVSFDPKEIQASHPDIISGFLLYKFGCIFSLKCAISKENQEQKKKLAFEKIIKSICQGFEVYYTTFLAKDEDTGESKIYQTRVWLSMFDGENEVIIFRERADQTLQPGEDTQGVDMEVFPNLPTTDDARRLVNLDNDASGEDLYYYILCSMSVKFALREMDKRENKDRCLKEIIESSYGADLSFRTTFKVVDTCSNEYKMCKTVVNFNMTSGELVLEDFEETQSG